MNYKRLSHYCSFPTVRNWIAVYLALFYYISLRLTSYCNIILLQRLSVSHCVTKQLLFNFLITSHYISIHLSMSQKAGSVSTKFLYYAYSYSCVSKSPISWRSLTTQSHEVASFQLRFFYLTTRLTMSHRSAFFQHHPFSTSHYVSLCLTE